MSVENCSIHPGGICRSWAAARRRWFHRGALGSSPRFPGWREPVGETWRSLKTCLALRPERKRTGRQVLPLRQRPPPSVCLPSVADWPARPRDSELALLESPAVLWSKEIDVGPGRWRGVAKANQQGAGCIAARVLSEEFRERRATCCAGPTACVGRGPEAEAPFRTSSAGRQPAKFKHINKRRKRNQPGFPE